MALQPDTLEQAVNIAKWDGTFEAVLDEEKFEDALDIFVDLMEIDFADKFNRKELRLFLQTVPEIVEKFGSLSSA